LKSDTPYKETIPSQAMSTPMKIPRTTNEKYEIIRVADEEQRRRKTSVKREATVSPNVCRRIMMGANPIPPSKEEVANHHIISITLPCEDSSVHTPTPLPGSDSAPSATTPHARPFEAQPNSPW
jgi:hypothetical protein